MVYRINLKIRAWKSMAKIFLANNISVYIRDIERNYYGKIVNFDDKQITVNCFSPTKDNYKVGTFSLEWNKIIKFYEFKNEI